MLDAAYVGAAGLVAQFFESGGWPEAAILAQTLPCWADYQVAVVQMTSASTSASRINGTGTNSSIRLVVSSC